MSAIFLIILFASLGSYHAFENLPDDAHGKEVWFHRNIYGIKKYIHKGVVFVPLKYAGSVPVLADSDNNSLNPNWTYILHLWYPGSTKSSSRIRLDPLNAVWLGDDFEVVADRPNVLPIDEGIDRGISVLGRYHRGFRYSVIGNNCGNFVAWCKYGRSDHDTQLDDWIYDKFKRFDIPREYAAGVLKIIHDTYNENTEI